MAIIETENGLPAFEPSRSWTQEAVPIPYAFTNDTIVFVDASKIQAQLDRIERMLRVLTGFGYVSPYPDEALEQTEETHAP